MNAAFPRLATLQYFEEGNPVLPFENRINILYNTQPRGSFKT